MKHPFFIISIVVAVWLANSLTAAERPVKDSQAGALVWRPYAGKIIWTGAKDVTGYATGSGTLVVLDNAGNEVASFTGMMRSGRLVGQISAIYKTSTERASYIGGFSNWSENGMGTMTFRNGKHVSGQWRDGELVLPDSPSVPPSIPTPTPTPAPTLPADNSADSELQAAYDRLKGNLPGNARDDLISQQRAWLRFQQQFRDIADKLWPSQPEAKLTLDTALIRHRTVEIQFIQNVLGDGDIRLESESKVLALRREVNSALKTLATKVGDPMVKPLVESWQEASQLNGLITLSGWRPQSITAAQATHFALSLRNLLDAVSLTNQQPSAPAIPVPAAPVAMTPPAPVAVPPETLERLNQSADEILKRITAHWKMDRPVTATPTPLDQSLGTDLVKLCDELRPLNLSDPLFKESKSLHSARSLERFNRVITELQKNGPDAVSQMSRCLEPTDNPEAPHALWWRQVTLRVEGEHKQADSLIAELPALIRKSDFDAVAARMPQIARLSPRPGLAEFSSLQKAVTNLLRDKSLRAVDTEWQKPTLTPLELFADLTKASAALETNVPHELQPAVTALRPVIDAATLLRGFVEDISPSGDGDTPHPIEALRKAKEKELWKSAFNSKSPLIQPILDRLTSLETLIGPKLTEYQTLLDSAAKAESSQKHIQASELFRKAYAMDKQPALLKRARDNEGKASGL